MPGFDKTGPGGQGPLTGRGLGTCRGNKPEESSDQQAPLGRGYRRGRGRGGGRRPGRGTGRGTRGGERGYGADF